MKPKIFIVADRSISEGHLGTVEDWYGFALAQDGTGLKGHLSTNKIWLRSDMGLTMESARAHKWYREHYPDGYELIDYIDATDEILLNDPAYQLAHKINQGEKDVSQSG